MLPRFFIDRPIFAWVIAIVIALAGALSILQLPVSQYPQIAPPSVSISATYPGASAQTVEDTVTQVIERQMTGLDNMLYMSSSSDGSGSSSITITFAQGTDPDVAQVQVQNKLANALPSLPLVVQRQTVRVAKSTGNFLMIVGLISDSPNVTANDMSDFASATLLDQLSRVEGVGEVQLFGAAYAMRIWLDPNRLKGFALTPGDVVAAITAQNAEVSAGQIGAQPYVEGQQLNATVSAQSLLETPEEFRAILLRTLPDGSTVRLQDVARVELGAENYGFDSRFNGEPASGLAISLASGANAVETAARVRQRIA